MCIILPDCVGKGEVDSTQAVPRLPTAAHWDEQKIPTGIHSQIRRITGGPLVSPLALYTVTSTIEMDRSQNGGLRTAEKSPTTGILFKSISCAGLKYFILSELYAVTSGCSKVFEELSTDWKAWKEPDKKWPGWNVFILWWLWECVCNCVLMLSVFSISKPLI